MTIRHRLARLERRHARQEYTVYDVFTPRACKPDDLVGIERERQREEDWFAKARAQGHEPFVVRIPHPNREEDNW